MQPNRPASAGVLHIGTVIYEHGVFSAEMLFVVNGSIIGEDAIKSAAQAASRHFLTLLHENGYQDHGYPDVRVLRREVRSILFRIEAPADRATPRVITICEDTREEPKGDANGGDKMGDPA